jgi:hypothetical protein
LIRGGRLLRGAGAEKGEYEHGVRSAKCGVRSAKCGVWSTALVTEVSGGDEATTSLGSWLIIRRVDWMRRRRKDDYRWVQVARPVLPALVSALCADVIAMAVPG